MISSILNLDFFISVVGNYLQGIVVDNFQSLNDFCLKYKIYFETDNWTVGKQQGSLFRIFGFLNSQNYISNLVVWQEDKFINHIYEKFDLKVNIILKRSERQGTHPHCRNNPCFWDKLPENYLSNLLEQAASKLQ